MRRMVEFLCLFGPGAVTWLLSEKLSKKKRKALEYLVEIIAYSAVDLVAVWFVLHYLLSAGDLMSADEIIGELSGNILYFAAALVVAVVIGFFAALIRTADLKIIIVNNPDGFWNRLDARKRKILKCTVGVIVITAVAAVSLAPKINDYLLEKSRTDCKQTASTLLDQIKDLVEGADLEELGDLTVDGMTVKRVEEDQHWTKGCSEGTSEAVYMVDGNGAVVYFSYRNQNYTATWSGPSSDEEFLEEQGGWNGGKGSGWTGSSI